MCPYRHMQRIGYTSNCSDQRTKNSSGCFPKHRKNANIQKKSDTVGMAELDNARNKPH